MNFRNLWIRQPWTSVDVRGRRWIWVALFRKQQALGQVWWQQVQPPWPPV